MKIEEKDKPKVMVMGVLALGFLGYMGFTLMSGPALPPAEASGKASPSPKTKTVASAGNLPDDEASVQGFLKTYQMDKMPHDPFLPNGILAPSPQPSPSPQATPSIQATPGPVVITTNPPLPGTERRTDENVVVVKGPTPAPQPPPGAPDYTVKGVLIGEESVAILRQGDDLKFVQEGYPIGNGYVIGDINKNSVDFVYERNPLYHKRVTVGSGGK
jgi:hypothetical protein